MIFHEVGRVLGEASSFCAKLVDMAFSQGAYVKLNCTDMVCCSKDLPIVIFALAISLLLKKDKKANFKNSSPQLMLA